MNNIVSLLKKAKKHNKIISIFIDPYDMSGCSVGFVDQVNDIAVRLKSVTPFGESAGYEVRMINDIVRLDYDGMYEKKIEFLNKNIKNVYKEIELKSYKNDMSIIVETLKEAKEKELIVTLWTKDKDDSIIGYIDHVSNELIKILSIDDYGQEDGIIAVKSSEITMLDCNSPKNQIINFLYKSKTQFIDKNCDANVNL